MRERERTPRVPLFVDSFVTRIGEMVWFWCLAEGAIRCRLVAIPALALAAVLIDVQQFGRRLSLIAALIMAGSSCGMSGRRRVPHERSYGFCAVMCAAIDASTGTGKVTCRLYQNDRVTVLV